MIVCVMLEYHESLGIYFSHEVKVCFKNFQDMKFWKHQFEQLMTEIRDRKREEEKKLAEAQQASADKENKTNEKTAPSVATGESGFF